MVSPFLFLISVKKETNITNVNDNITRKSYFPFYSLNLPMFYSYFSDMTLISYFQTYLVYIYPNITDMPYKNICSLLLDYLYLHSLVAENQYVTRCCTAHSSLQSDYALLENSPNSITLRECETVRV